MNILILGSLPENDEQKELYEVLVEACKDFSPEISTPIDTATFKGSEEERYKRAFDKVAKADLIIGEQSKPSTGQGMEIQEAANLNKPLLVVAKKGSKVSGLVKGCPILQEIIYYENVEDLKKEVRRFLDGKN